jgi:8-oxo-dGTP pyrophosphatase MutT (NUDIX family)
MSTAVIQRKAARAILLTPKAEVLLMRVRLEGVAPFWMTPGGGLEARETTADGLRRELKEEVGLDQLRIGPLLWRLQHSYDFHGKRYCQDEEYFVVHVPRFNPRIEDETEAKEIYGFRWWTISELLNATERITPFSLANIIQTYLREGPPKEEPRIEVLVD